MHITFKANGYELTDVIRARVEEKIGSVQKLLGTDEQGALCEVELGRVIRAVSRWWEWPPYFSSETSRAI